MKRLRVVHKTSSQMLLSTPRFGGCRDSQTDEVSCALAPRDCESVSQYVKPNDIEQEQCNNPLSVTIGRCNSSIDKFLCATSENGCEVVSKYQRNVGTCNVIQDTLVQSTDPTTRYPLCSRKTGGTTEGRCVLTEDDCEDGSYQTPEALPWAESCFCHHVITGMCYLPSGENDADKSFCATGAYDCPDAYNFMSAPQLLNMDDPPRSCRLCREEDLDKNLIHKEVVESGACYSSSGVFLRCALESTECSAPESFKSSVEVVEVGQVPCRTEELQAGYCASSLDTVGCTNKANSCANSAKFESRDSCTLHSDLDTGEPTYFSRCRENRSKGGDWMKYRCVWQESECNADVEVYFTAAKPLNWFDGCNCEHVHTGGCEYKAGKFHCAVSALGCADPTTYRRAIDMEKMDIDCRLCQPIRIAVPATNNPTTQVHADIIASRQNNSPSSSPGTKPGLVGGIVAGTLFGLALLAAFILVVRKKKANIGNQEGGVDKVQVDIFEDEEK